MNTKHTPAPWVCEENELSASIDIISKEREFIVSIHPDIDTQFSKVDKANARLIAAAPELLEALQRALNDFRRQNWTEETYNIIESAIKKATE